jgi:uncharacterized protein YceK
MKSRTMQWSELATRYRGSPVAHFLRWPMKVRDALKFVGVGLLLCLLSRCGTIVAHQGFGGDMPCYVFAGVTWDVKALGETSAPSQPLEVPPVFCFFDLPFSLAADTVVLPYDALMVTVGGKRRNGEDRHPKPKPTEAQPRPAP